MRKYKKTIIGSMLLLLILLASCLYPLYGPADFNHMNFIEDKHGNIIGKPPFQPSLSHLFGTSRNGEDMFWLLLYGAKFTLIASFSVSLLRALFGVFFGLFLALWAPFLKSYFKDFFLAFRYIPSILIAIILMAPIVGSFNDVPIYYLIICQVIILVFLGIPAATQMTVDITDELLKTSFVQSSFLMGASKFHVVRRHLFPYIRYYSVLFTVQQLLSTLQIMMHLGIFGYFLGGLNRSGIFGWDDPKGSAAPATLSYEWAGLIGQGFKDFNLAPWTVFTPVLGFFFVIVIVNMMKKETEDNILGLEKMKWKKKIKQASSVKQSGAPLNKFKLIKEEQNNV
jgi:peptide/nickel transport system permease protein